MLDRDEDMLVTGGRHPFYGRYKVGCFPLLEEQEHYSHTLRSPGKFLHYFIDFPGGFPRQREGRGSGRVLLL